MQLLKKVYATINKYSMLSQADHVLIGLSGGPDSVCLAAILNELRKDFNLVLSAVYVDHGLRPDETEDEKTFCKDFCEKLGIKFFTKAIDVKKYAKDRELSIQEAGRELRYQVFNELSKEINATKIALGHNADDQAETFLMRLLRGSGPLGLSGIPPVRRLEFRFQISELGVKKNILIIRPLIEIERKDIEDFLNSSLVTRHSSLPYIVDSSNLKKDYFRNWLRLTVMPELKSLNPALIENICRTTDILREEDTYLELIVTKTIMKLISRKDKYNVELFLAPLETMEKIILRRIIRRAISEIKGLRGFGFGHIEDIITLIKQGKPGDRLYLPKGIRIIKKYSTILITVKPPLRLSPKTFSVPGEVVLEETGITLKAWISEELIEEIHDGKISAVFDYSKLSIPLEIRARKSGDYFYPSGFGKRKKLQDFFVDNKIPRDERDTIPILVSGGDVVWVAGYRADERFVAKKDTKRFLVIKVLER